MSESRNHSNILTFKHSNIRTLFKRFFAGGHRGVVTPVPIPNTEVKGSIAEGSAGLARARVGRCRLFLFKNCSAITSHSASHMLGVFASLWVANPRKGRIPR